MRVADSLTLPAELERARAALELVVFAGAGVSMGPPASLPSFTDLARQIAEGKLGWDPGRAKGLDRYLGRAERAGLDVQARARMLLESEADHTPLHAHLLGIFETAEHVRLITTNFDTHFASAVESVFPGAHVPRYVGPALPPGGGFKGIVQLHGALDHPHDPLVLTDTDFAAAYMAEGWAARFLVRAFEGRTVLFVGYSLTDPLMQYLLHALPPSDRWFALWHEKEVDQGADHSITAVPFKDAPDRSEYGDLNAGMERWHWYVRAAASDHDQELRRLIALGPPVSPQDVDYVRARLRTEVGREVFWRTATDERWFEWVVSEGLLDGLTDDADRDPETPLWGQWCLDHFCGGANPQLLRFLRGRSLRLQPWFGARVISHVCFTKPLPPLPVLRQLVALIASQSASPVSSRHDWQWLLKRLVTDGVFDLALTVLWAATRVQLQPHDRLFLSFDEAAEVEEPLRSLSIRIAMSVPAEELDHFLRESGEALADASAEGLLALGERRIADAYLLLDAAAGAEDSLDWLSYGRTAIAPTSQDRRGGGEDVLVALVRLSLDHLAVAQPERLRAFIRRHEGSQRVLLRRLALYGYAKSSDYPSDDVLTQAAGSGWAQDAWVRPEFYRLLDVHYPRASEQSVGEFVTALRDDTRWGDGELDRHSEHARFTLSQKLLRLAPASIATKEFAEAEKLAHPSFSEGDRDGYLSRVEVGWGSEEPSPISAEEMLASAPVDALAQIVERLREGREVGYAVLGEAQQAVRTDQEWAMNLFRLASASGGGEGVAMAVLRGLIEATASEADQAGLLNQIGDCEWTAEVTRVVGSVLDRWSTDLGEDTDHALLDALDTAADLVYARSNGVLPAIEDAGWFERAINHPAGVAARVWWRVAEARDWDQGEFVISVEDDEKRRWERVSRGAVEAASFARPILGMVTGRLIGGDYPWVAENVLPAFDPTEHSERAAQLWDGRLMHRRWSWTAVEGLEPYLNDFLSCSSELVPARSDELGDWIGFLLTSPEESGITLATVQRFVLGADEEARVSFARSLPQHLARLEPDDRVAVWTDMLLPYWRDRQTKMPVPLSIEEVEAMIGWVIALPEVADEVLAELGASPGEQFQHSDQMVWQWKQDSGWLDTNPDAAVGLIAFLATRRSIHRWSIEDALSALEAALSAGADVDATVAAAEGLVTLGSQQASAFIQRIST